MLKLRGCEPVLVAAYRKRLWVGPIWDTHFTSLTLLVGL